jgi:misacylated tRNA(Ala) deacylase
MHLLCHEQPDTLVVQTEIADCRPGKIALVQSPFYPGGGGQLADRGVVRWNAGEAKVVGFEYSAGKLWHLLDTQRDLAGAVEAAVDAGFRCKMRQLHTDTHILNALVFQSFEGALVTGVQMAADGTARMVSTCRRRQQAPACAGRADQRPDPPDIAVTFAYVPMHEAQAERGLISQPLGGAATHTRRQHPHRRDRRARSPGLRGTAPASTGGSPPIRILKIDNKGRHNRRVRIGLTEGP